ncbi:PAS domain S-box protein [Sulfurivermis fontis]|uniref:PAS domain S-box protein n=1 Tax=Sulfurivermis fontis TaxID=1972068 RepID=UPI000FD70BC9
MTIRSVSPIWWRRLLFMSCLLATLAQAAPLEVKIGVLAWRGPEQTLRMWEPTATYLTQHVAGYRFVIVPLAFDRLLPAVASGDVDFVLANSSYYPEMELRYGASRIVTLRNRDAGHAYTHFGGVIFTRAERADLREVTDLKGKSFMAVDEQSLGGFHAAWRELKDAGIDPHRDFKPLRFGGTHDAVVYAVRDGTVDAGTVRTDTLERMAKEGKIRLEDYRIIQPTSHPDFIFLSSTRLYPEWPMARLKHTPQDLAHSVALTLMQMPPDSEAARRSNTAGWTIPADYQPVHDLLRELRIGPYRDYGRVHPGDVLRQYWYWLLLGALAIVLLVGGMVQIGRVNRRLRMTDAELSHARDELERRVDERTSELRHALEELEDSRRRIELSQRDWHDAFDAIPHPIFIHDKDMRIVHGNPAYIARAGMDAAQIIGKPYWEVFPRGDGPLPACRQFPDRLQAHGDEVVLPSGEVFVSQSFGIRHMDGSIRHAIHILEDVTAERRAEAQRRTLSHAVAQAGEGILVLDPARIITYCNPALCGLLGGSHSEFEGRTLFELFLPAQHEQVNVILEQAARPEGWMGESLLRARGGRQIPVFLTASAIHDEQRVHTGYVFTLMDLSSVKEAEAALKYRLAFESLVGGIASRFVTASADSIEQEINRALQQIGQFVNADRAYIFGLDDEAGCLSNVHEWCAEGVTPQAARLAELAMDKFPWWLGRLKRNEPLLINDVMTLPPEAAAERDEFLAEGIRAMLMVPMSYGEHLAGYIGFDVTQQPRSWAKEDIRMLRAAGEIISSSLQRLAAELRVRRSEMRLKEAQEIAHLGNWEWDIVAGTLYWSDEIYRIFGIEPQAFGATYEAFLGYVHPDDRSLVEAAVDSALRQESAYEIDHRIVLPDGSHKVVHEKGQVIVAADGAPQRMIGTVQDVTDIRRAERELQRLNRALRTLSRGNETLVRAESEDQLVRDICQVLVDVGGFRLAWVGYPQQDAEKRILPVAWAGHDAGYLQHSRFSWGDDEWGRGPTGTALRSGETIIARDLLHDPSYTPWREEAQKRGYASLIALPLRHGSETLGVLTIDAAEPDAFDKEEVALLTELSNDLAFGIVSQRSRVRREAAERELAQSEERYRALAESAQDLIYRYQLYPERRFEYVSPSALEMTGYTPEEHYADPDLGLKLVHPDDRHLLEAMAAGEQVGDGVLTLRWIRKDGTLIWTEQRNTLLYDETGRLVALEGIARDITARKQVEDERKRIGESLQRSLVQTIQAIAVTIEKRDPYTAGHQQRVAELATAIAGEMGLPEEQREGLRLGALIHDIGKIYVPAEFLNRPGHLSDTEFEIIQSHPVMGHDIVKGIEFPWPVAQMVVQHHERLDGSGYPKGLKGDEILLEARILAVADVVEAMASHRPYRAALPLEEALVEIERFRGVRYDPVVVDACLRLFREKGFTWQGK